MREKIFEMMLETERGPAIEAWHGASLDAIINIVRTGFALAPTKNAKLFGYGAHLHALRRTPQAAGRALLVWPWTLWP